MNDKIIQFPGVRSTSADAPQAPVEGALAPPSRVEAEPAPVGRAVPPPAGLPLAGDRAKAVSLVVSGMTFILIGIKPTTSGADFFTACDGDADELRNAEQHLPGVITRLLQRKGIR